MGRNLKTKFQIQTHPFGWQFYENELKLNFGNLKLGSDNMKSIIGSLENHIIDNKVKHLEFLSIVGEPKWSNIRKFVTVVGLAIHPHTCKPESLLLGTFSSLPSPTSI